MNFKSYSLFLVVCGTCHCYVNVALNKQTYQQYPFRQGDDTYDSSNVVDGLRSDLTWNGGQCAFSESKDTATMRVNLGSIHSIHNTTIYFMTGNLQWGQFNFYASSFLGFSVYVSNTTDKSQGFECFKDSNFTMASIPDVFSASCPVHGQYVIYNNERLSNITYPKEYSAQVQSNLCEVEVYGCPTTGYYGSNCSRPCPDVNCQYCHIVTGTCQGCKPGYRGHQCELACPHGYFGKDCAKKCNDTCIGCNTVNGLCESGCVPGWKGDFCHKACERGSYGSECNKKCGHCRDVDQCSNTNGSCLTGCDAGYQGDLCKKSCEKGLYGLDCNETCGSCQNLTQCLSINGNCLTGCVAGYTGDLCKTQCGRGNYGINCLQKCGQCLNKSPCNKFDGSCPDGCSAGYNGSLCSKHCEKTFYGINCTLKCSKNCSNQACHHVTGDCIDLQQTDDRKTQHIHILWIIAATAINPAIISLLVIIYIRTKVKTRTQRNDSGKTNASFDGDETLHMYNSCENISLKEEPIADFAITNLDTVIKENSKNKDDGFKQEYERLLCGERYKCDTGRRPDNTQKNRFKFIFPYDHSRVILDTDSSDYINANYIDGFEEENAYIATQGPKQQTVSDFWFMVWQTNVVQIVMLTNLKEGTKKKCAQYWPGLNKCMDCDIFTLDTTDEKQYAYYVTRTVKITNKKENTTRTITHYHYTEWPDHNVPDPLCLVLFHNHVRRSKPSAHKGPTLVHCSAGIGRTGTYIAIDALCKEVQQQNKINIAAYVTIMREKRMNMVQTREQYKTIFLTLYEISKAPATVQKPPEFIEKIETAKMNTLANVCSLRDEFQKLVSIRLQRTDNNDKKVSESEEDEDLLVFTSSLPNLGSNIDRIFIHSFTNQNAFIVTHCPPADDVVEFLGLITEYKSEVVVFMDPLNSIESTETWLPTPSTSFKRVPPFFIQLQGDTKENKSHKVKITKDDETWFMVHLAAPTHDITSDNAQTVSQILGLVLFAQNTIREGPIIVVSKDGTALCGVFCAVYNLIQQLTMDEEIDVFSVVRLLQTRRPELCGTMEEYEMINYAMMTFIQSRTDENTYYNQ